MNQVIEMTNGYQGIHLSIFSLVESLLAFKMSSFIEKKVQNGIGVSLFNVHSLLELFS